MSSSNTNSNRFYDEGMELYEKGKYQEARKILTESLQQDSTHYLSLVVRGLCNSELGLINEAHQDFNDAIDLNSDDSYAWYGRGFLYDNQNEKEKAIEDYKKVLTLEPEHEFAGKYLNDAERSVKQKKIAEEQRARNSQTQNQDPADIRDKGKILARMLPDAKTWAVWVGLALSLPLLYLPSAYGKAARAEMVDVFSLQALIICSIALPFMFVPLFLQTLVCENGILKKSVTGSSTYIPWNKIKSIRFFSSAQNESSFIENVLPLPKPFILNIEGWGFEIDVHMGKNRKELMKKVFPLIDNVEFTLGNTIGHSRGEYNPSKEWQTLIAEINTGGNA